MDLYQVTFINSIKFKPIRAKEAFDKVAYFLTYYKVSAKAICI